jgi:ubiquinone/menaquinone biosynthesis C-methylase UbiE
MAEKYFDHSFGATAPENYQRFFVPVIGKPLAEDLLRKAGLKAGERVLDVGCGTGVVTRLAAEQVGREGTVAGLDINPGMLAVAKSVTRSQPGIEWYEASADAIPLPDETFDVVLCQLSLQFVSDRSMALQEMHRVLAPDGRLVLNLPGPADPLFETLANAMGRHISAQAAGFVQAVFALHDETELEELLSSAGFRDISVQAETRELSLPGARDFLWQYLGSTPLAGVIAEASEEARSALEGEVLAEWSEHEEAGGIPYRQRIVTASARR